MNKKNLNILIIFICASLVVATYFFSVARRQVEADSGYRLVMGTFAHIIAVAPNSHTANKSIQASLQQLRNIEELMSYHRDDSELANVNRNAYREPVKVSKETFEVIQKAIEFSKLSSGAFDVTVGTLMDLWHKAGEANTVPSDDKLAEARSKVGCEKVILDVNETTVRFAVEGMKLDLGGIAKGYAIDKAVEAMANSGAVGGLVDVGGNIRCFGKPKDKPYWRIGLQDPNENLGFRISDFGFPAEAGKPLLILKLNDAAVATSGHYRRFAQIQGKKYSHIIDTTTGFSSDKLASVTIIAKDATTADALSTAVIVMGAEKGLALIEKLPETEAILITSLPKYEIMKTAGAKKYIKYNILFRIQRKNASQSC